MATLPSRDDAAPPPGKVPGALLGTARRGLVWTLAHLPRPARLLWMCLVVLGAYGMVFNLDGMGLGPLILFPGVAAAVDLAFQRMRFPEVRPPDAALATGLLLALLLPPTVSLPLGAVVTLVAITLRHVVRYRQRPILNPAALGVLVGVLAFGTAPAWWGSIQIDLVVGLGVLLALRSPGSWRLSLGYLLTYAALSPLEALLLGQIMVPQVLLLRIVDPSNLFFALFMVAEPRTSPLGRGDRVFYGLYVGIGAAFLPAVLPTLAPFVALVLGNGIAVAALHADSRVTARAGNAARRAARRATRRRPSREREAWGDLRPGQRAAAVIGAAVLVGTVVLASQVPAASTTVAQLPPTIAPRTASLTAVDCTKDNASVPANLLSYLHQRLGPSVVLSADTNSGAVVFYDPANRATVTETDIYEDFGYAEFNGDDYAVMGCSP